VIEWTEQALRQLEQVHDYITLTNSDEIAARVTSKILDSVQRLVPFPVSGRKGRVRGTRELVIADTPFIAAYTVVGDRVVILALYHGARQWPETF